MATSLNPGFENNVNVIEIRVDGCHQYRVTDRPIDIDGDGDQETVTITHVSGDATGTPSAPGGKIRNTVTIPAGVARTIVSQSYETDGGVTTDRNVTQFTEGD